MDFPSAVARASLIQLNFQNHLGAHFNFLTNQAGSNHDYCIFFCHILLRIGLLDCESSLAIAR
jgi:hypothetical protein